MKIIRYFAIAILSLAASSTAYAKQCPGYEASADQDGDLTYSPADVRQGRVSVEIRLADPDVPRNCNQIEVAIVAQDGGLITLQKGGETLPATFIRSPSVLRVDGNGVALAPAARNSLLNNGMIRVDFLAIESGNFVTPGVYAADLELVVGDNAPVPFTVTLLVEPGVKLLATNGTQTLSLGEVSEGASVSTQFFYRTNASLNITARSDNQGRLVHEDGPDFGYIDYDAFISGRLLNLAEGDEISLPFVTTAENSEELEVRVAPQPNKFAGRYTDTLTLTFTAN